MHAAWLSQMHCTLGGQWAIQASGRAQKGSRALVRALALAAEDCGGLLGDHDPFAGGLRRRPTRHLKDHAPATARNYRSLPPSGRDG